MESYGNLLRMAREQKNLDVETVARETSIPSYYIEALEMEHFDKFPGEAYFAGFLRNYAEYIGLDNAYLFSLFRAKMIQAAPVPDALLKRDRPWFVLPLIAVGALALLAALGYGGVVFLKPVFERIVAAKAVPEKSYNGTVYRLNSEPFKRRVYVGDSIIIPANLTKNGEKDITIEVSNTLASLLLKTPVGEQRVELGEELELDVGGTGNADIIVFVSDISNTDISRGAEIRALLKNVTPGANSAISDAPPGGSVSLVVLEDTRAYPFTLRVNFRDMCVFRYQADNQGTIEDLFSNNALVTIQANNGIRLWLSNDNAARLQIIADGKSFDLDVDKVSQVAVRDLRWIRTAPVAYQLVVIEVD
ncbi:MAG: helix-turn-helix domain-containing protein [Treponema sp.]|jgi:cytoskeletal protein RodZ|nr:helix-turn-helix domain-containing protein [Treponema sp.]